MQSLIGPDLSRPSGGMKEVFLPQLSQQRKWYRGRKSFTKHHLVKDEDDSDYDDYDDYDIYIMMKCVSVCL